MMASDYFIFFQALEVHDVFLTQLFSSSANNSSRLRKTASACVRCCFGRSCGICSVHENRLHQLFGRSALNLSAQRFNTLLMHHPLLESFKCFKPSVVKRQHVRGYTGLSFLEYLPEILHRQRPWLSPSVACLT